MSRLLSVLVGVALLAVSCAGSVDLEEAEANADPTLAEQAADELDEPVSEEAVPAPPEDVSVVQVEEPEALLLPDPDRWVVVDDWAREGAATAWPDDDDSLQLDFAPLDEHGVPQLGRRIAVRYQLGEAADFERQWGGRTSIGDGADFETDAGIGRVVAEEGGQVAMAQLWSAGTFVNAQTMDPDADLVELAKSFTKVDQATWDAARGGAAAQRLVAVEVAMQNVDIVESTDEPLPHWIFPEPWNVRFITDMTIWTPEQRAQRDALGQANRGPRDPVSPSGYRTLHFGYSADPDTLTVPFVPQVMLTVSVFDEPTEPLFPLNYDRVSALGLDGVISGAGQVFVELGTGSVRVFVNTTGLTQELVIEFLDSIEFAAADPLDGVVVAGERFQAIELADWEGRSPSWHAAWEHPEGGATGQMSVWRLSVSELRQWLLSRGAGMAIPDDVWETIAARGVVDFGSQTTYDSQTGLLRTLRGIDASELIPLELDDWIAFAEPVNSDPLNPR